MPKKALTPQQQEEKIKLSNQEVTLATFRFKLIAGRNPEFTKELCRFIDTYSSSMGNARVIEILRNYANS